MNKDLEMALVLLGAIILFWFGMAILIIGREIYGSDASLLWASGILTLLAINGIGSFISYLWRKEK